MGEYLRSKIEYPISKTGRMPISLSLWLGVFVRDKVLLTARALGHAVGDYAAFQNIKIIPGFHWAVGMNMNSI